MNKVMILNPYLFTLGGGEKHMGYLCDFLENYFNKNVKIDIVVYNIENIHNYDKNKITVQMLNKRFGLDLKCTTIVKIDYRKPKNKVEFLKEKRTIEKITSKYDLFINFKFMSKHEGHALKNIYECMFPPKSFQQEMGTNKISKIIGKFFDKRFLKSYNSIIVNSEYTNEWFKKYWRSEESVIIPPPVFSKTEISGRYNEQLKENIIISVGRFFKGAHCKQQKEMLEFFINNIDEFSEYQYYLIGAVSNVADDIRYLEEIKQMASPYTNIKIFENCPYEQLLETYKKAKIFWHATGYLENERMQPEKMEHFGITTVEAMSFGVVPVVINRGGQKEIVDFGVNGYLWSNENECIAYTKKLFEEEHRIYLAQEAIKKSENYTTEVFNDKHRALFVELGV